MRPKQIEREVHVAAPAARVWRLLTEAEHIGKWFASAGAEIDLRPGGPITFRWDEHGTFHGRIERVEPERVLSYRWSLVEDEEPGPGNSTLVEFTLTPEDGGTRVRVHESGFDELDASAERRARHVEENIEGWTGGLGGLKEYAEG